MKKYLSKILVGVGLIFMMIHSSWAELKIAIENTKGLSFGSFVAGNGGFVTVNANGRRNGGGDVSLISLDQGGAAKFKIIGAFDVAYRIELPSNDFVRLTGPGIDMLVNNFTSTPSFVGGQLGAGGSQVLFVGGTLNVGSDQTPGNYSGTFSVTVDYN